MSGQRSLPEGMAITAWGASGMGRRVTLTNGVDARRAPSRPGWADRAASTTASSWENSSASSIPSWESRLGVRPARRAVAPAAWR